MNISDKSLNLKENLHHISRRTKSNIQNHCQPVTSLVTKSNYLSLVTMSEIDDIFFSKARFKQKKKRKPSATPSLQKSKSVEESSSKKRPLPETVVDTSTDLAGPSKRRKKDGIHDKNKKPKKTKKDREPTDFGDSRGSGDRKSNHLTFWSILLRVLIGPKTEEGWVVYKEAELGLNNEGGGKWLSFRIFMLFTVLFELDTPLCPFDCNCCKSLSSCVIITVKVSFQRFLNYLLSINGTFEALLIAFHDWNEVNLLPKAILVSVVVSRCFSCWRLKQIMQQG